MTPKGPMTGEAAMTAEGPMTGEAAITREAPMRWIKARWRRQHPGKPAPYLPTIRR